MTEREPSESDAIREADAAAAEAGAIGGRADEDRDPAMAPVEDAGGGESEGFEQAEEELREQAEHGDAPSDPASDAFPPEWESGDETAVHGEADQAVIDDRDDAS